MSVALYLDHNMHGPVINGLRPCGVDILTAREDGMDRAADERLLERATELGWVFVTQDEDFKRISARWLALGRDFAGLVHVPQRGMSIGKMIEDLETVARVMNADTMWNREEFLPL